MVETQGRDTRASDLNLVYGLAKIFDPNSVVREGEMVLVKDTSSIPQWLQGEIARLNGGAALQPQARASILQEARGRVTAYQEQLRPVHERYSGIAGRHGIPASDFGTDLTPFAEIQMPSATQSAPSLRLGNGPQQAGAANQSSIPTVGSAAEARRLPRGTMFRDPSGRLRRVP
jgi:hypothetical protein